MKRLTCTLGALVLGMWICPAAKADYAGALRGDQGWEIAVDNSTAGSTALTVYYLGDHHVLDLDLLAVQAGARTLLSFPMPGNRVRRIVIQVDPTENNSVGLLITQAGSSHSHSSDGDSRIVLDVR